MVAGRRGWQQDLGLSLAACLPGPRALAPPCDTRAVTVDGDDRAVLNDTRTSRFRDPPADHRPGFRGDLQAEAIDGLATDRSANDTEREAAQLGVNRVIHLDLPGLWLSMTAPLLLSWKREVVFWAALVLVGFVAGLALGVRVAAGQ
jgi:hypothetical protein